MTGWMDGWESVANMWFRRHLNLKCYKAASIENLVMLLAGCAHYKCSVWTRSADIQLCAESTAQRHGNKETEASSAGHVRAVLQ
eukprot:scaffold222557_cov20-Prasinocladus_malaysianus.AAC.1